MVADNGALAVDVEILFFAVETADVEVDDDGRGGGVGARGRRVGRVVAEIFLDDWTCDGVEGLRDIHCSIVSGLTFC